MRMQGNPSILWTREIKYWEKQEEWNQVLLENQ